MEMSRDEVLATVAKDGWRLMDACEEFLTDREIVLAAVASCGSALQFADLSLRGDRGVVLAAVTRDGHAMEFAEKHLRGDHDLLLVATKSHHAALKVASAELRENREFILKCIERNARALEYAPACFREEQDLAVKAVSVNGFALEHMSEAFRANRVICMAAVSNAGMALRHVSPELRKDREIVFTAVRNGGMALEFAASELRNDLEVVLGAIHNDPLAYGVASEKLRENEEVAMETMQLRGMALQCAPSRITSLPDIASAAVKQNSGALMYVGVDLRDNKEFHLEIVKDNGSALRYATPDMQRDPDVVLTAVKHTGRALQYAHPELRNTPQIVLAAVTTDGNALRFASTELKADDDIVKAATDALEGLERVIQGLREGLAARDVVALPAFIEEGRRRGAPDADILAAERFMADEGFKIQLADAKQRLQAAADGRNPPFGNIAEQVAAISHARRIGMEESHLTPWKQILEECQVDARAIREASRTQLEDAISKNEEPLLAAAMAACEACEFPLEQEEMERGYAVLETERLRLSHEFARNALETSKAKLEEDLTLEEIDVMDAAVDDARDRRLPDVELKHWREILKDFRERGEAAKEKAADELNECIMNRDTEQLLAMLENAKKFGYTKEDLEQACRDWDDAIQDAVATRQSEEIVAEWKRVLEEMRICAATERQKPMAEADGSDAEEAQAAGEA
eukprot:TRINITY_DN18904_c0_g1_i1.p1 TRINITY_DN18904_c0_g1~~TRINITY_DN18904_c0_g1_i1.p1  ORF type:complete len:694 (+),score=158.90 TRINITY_DN18904_c0_g1_i1:105-2186(+)